MNKKVIFVTILAFVLALCAALALRPKHEPKQIAVPEETQEEVVVSQDEFVSEETVEQTSEEQTEKTDKQSETVKKTVKARNNIQTNVKKVPPKPVVKQLTEIKVKANVEEKTETTVQEAGVNIDEVTKDVVVVKEHKSSNTFKYIYTPVRFKSK